MHPALRMFVTVKVFLAILLATSTLSAQTPAITSLTVNGVAGSNAGAVGTPVTINGTSFGTQGTSSTVTFNNLPATPVSWSATAISVNVPTGASTGNIVVNPAGTVSNPWQFMVVPGTQTPGINFVQGNYATATTPPTVSVVYPAAQVGGDLNVVAVGWRNTACAVTSVTDNSANTYMIAVGPSHINNEMQSVYYAKNISAAGAGVNKITVIFSCTGTINSDIRIAEYSDINTTSPVDVVSAYAATGTTCVTPGATTTNANDLLFATDFVIITPTSAGTGYTSRVITTSIVNPGNVGGSIVEDRVVTATGNYTASVTLPQNRDCIVQMVAFRAILNQAPVVSAGSNQTITLPTTTATLTGTATDDGLPNKTLTLAWTQVSGPGTATFSSPATASTQVTVPQVAGTYVLKLTASDSSLSTSATMTLTVNPAAVNLSVSLTPTSVGPNVAGTTQKMTAVATSNGTAVPGAVVQFTVTGANPTSGSGTTDATGTTTFTYTGALKGTDTVQASTGGSTSNSATVNWIVPVQPISTTTVFGRFFVGDTSATTGIFDALPTWTPVFSQEFPTINFNPPFGVVPGNNSGIGTNSRPFTDVTTDVNGHFTGLITAQGNGFQAGLGVLFSFQAVFTGSFTIASAGNVSFNFFSDDGFVLGVNGGATHVSGPMTNVPVGGVTAFQNYTVVGSYNQGSAPFGNVEIVNFPAPGTYQYEVDYTECCGQGLSLTMGNYTSSIGTAPTGTLALSPINPASIPTGQVETLTVQATDGSGLAVASTVVTLAVAGANPQTLSATTDTTGKATFQYSGFTGGSDTVQALASIGGQGTFSNLIVVPWSATGGGTLTLVQQGWIGSPLLGAVVQGQVPITVPAMSLASGTLKYFPTSNPSAVTILNAATTGSGTMGMFDATLLQNGGYTIQLDAVSTAGVAQRSIIAVIVTGENKPGRVRTTVTDFKVPLAGIPINIARTYDSLVRSKVGDFGQGWSLDVGVDLSVDAFNNVTFTFNKQRITFNFTPQSTGSSLFAWLLVPKYRPAPGFYGSLTSDGCNALVQVQNSVVCFPSTGAYQPTTYTYTDPSGRAYTVSASGTLQSIKDLNGNVLTLTSSGISSSAGSAAVTFSRDSQGRISQITDLNGKNYIYTYDGSGNLFTVQQPGVSTVTTYLYTTDHLLNSIQDPLGNTVTSTFYADGRLKDVTDTATPPNITRYSYDLVANTVTTTWPDGGITVQTNNAFGKPTKIVDPLNQITQFTYDANQNVLQYTDALNKITTYTYDVNGFQTSITDPLLHKSSKTYNQFGEVVTATDAVQNVQTTLYDSNFNPYQTTDSIGRVSASTFYPNGTLKTLTDPNGNSTTFVYDVHGYPSTTTDAAGNFTQYFPDSMARVATKIDPRGNSTSYTYDFLGNLKSVTDVATNSGSQYTYDNNGNLATSKDGLGNQTTYTPDVLNRVKTITYPDTPQTTRQYTYDFRGNKLTETDQSGHVTQYTYDLGGQLKTVTSAFGTIDAGTITYTYDADGRKKTVKDEVGNLTTNNYDDSGCLTSVVDGTNKTTTYTCYADGKRNTLKDANNNTTTYAYDARGRLATITYPDNTTDKYTYYGAGELHTHTDQAGQVTTNALDLANRLKTVLDAQQQQTTYGYDFNGNLTSVTDGLNRQTLLAYDSLNRRSTRQLPLNSTQEVYAYDAASNLKTKKDFNGKTTTYGYDALNRLKTKTPDASLSQPTISFTYWPTGVRNTMVDTSGTTTYTVDNRDRVLTKATPEGTLTYSYDAHSNAKTITSSNANGASATYGYDGLNRVASVVDNRLVAQGGAGTTNYNFDPAGNLLNLTQPNGVVTSYTLYDSLNRLKQMSSTKGATTLASFAYTLFPAGNRQTAADLGGRSATYGYDNDYRLTSEAITADPGGVNGTVGYTLYDAANNRKTMTSTLSAIPGGTFSYDGNDQMTTDTYDANGNTISSGGITRTYDFENHLTGYGAVVIQNDGDGNRVSETIGGVTTKYLVDSLNPTGYAQVMDEVVGTAVSRTYTYGLNRISENQLVGSTWTPSFYGYDGHGNVRFLTSTAGAVTDSFKYDAFGVLIGGTGSTANNFLYGGEQYDTTLHLYYLRARYYNPAVGRFQTADRYEGDILNPPTLHKYVYTGNNPVNRIDPTGSADEEEYGSILDKNILKNINRIKKLWDPAQRRRLCYIAATIKAPTFTPPFDPLQTIAYFEACLVRLVGQGGLN